MHYSVAVITPDGDYDTALEPYSAWLETEPYIISTAKELVAEQRKELAWAKKSNQKNYQAFLEATYDFSSDETLIESIKAYNKPDRFFWYDENNNKVATYNKNEKWDWKVLGGRFADYLILKDGTRADIAEAKSIDFDAYKLSETEQERQTRFWQVNVEGLPRTKEEIDSHLLDTFYKPEYYKEKYSTLENFLKQQGSFRTYAVLYKGTWLEPDEELGEEGYRAYHEALDKILAELSPTDIVAIVDLHDW